jgi:hypothetical protein
MGFPENILDRSGPNSSSGANTYMYFPPAAYSLNLNILPCVSMPLYFEVGTYRLAGGRVTMEKDGKELLISSEHNLVNETLPVGNSVDWSLSDLYGVSSVDDPNSDHALPEVVSVEELRLKTQST